MGETADSKAKPQIPRKKGGAMFPRIKLGDAVEYAKKLASKTHTGPMPESIVLPGVFGSATGRGQIKASALKQFGLMEGTSKGYSASPLARKIATAPPEELPVLLRDAFLSPKVFRALFETFQGDMVSFAKIRQGASQSGVHPDELDNCARLFVESAKFAQLGTEKGESLQLSTLAYGVSEPEAVEHLEDPGTDALAQRVDERSEGSERVEAVERAVAGGHPSGRSIIHVNVTIDSSLDTDKLEKHLALLRRYGAI